MDASIQNFQKGFNNRLGKCYRLTSTKEIQGYWHSPHQFGPVYHCARSGMAKTIGTLSRFDPNGAKGSWAKRTC